MSDGDDRDVIVVGAGPVGLALALGLARGGGRVLVLERAPGTAEHSRAPAIWPRTQEVLADLGLVGAFLARGRALQRLTLHDADSGTDLISIPLEELEGETRFPQLLILPQSETERLLLDAVRRHDSARVLFSAEVTGIEQDDAGVSVRYARDGERHAAWAPFAAGCDGAHSAVRESLGIAFEGETYGTRAALADLRLPGSEDLPFPRLSTREGFAVGIRMTEGLWRLILPFPADEGRPPDRRVAAAATRLFPEVTGAEDYETAWRSEFRLHRRIASRYVVGRVALAGDAAHLNSPVGGQGMNAGIQDTPALAAALLEALRTGEPSRLGAYERERRPAVEGGVNPFTDRLTRGLLFGRGRAVRPLLRAADLTLRVPPLRRRFLRRLAMLS